MGFQCGAPAANQNAILVMILVGTIARDTTKVYNIVLSVPALGKGRVPWARGNYAARWAELFVQM